MFKIESENLAKWYAWLIILIGVIFNIYSVYWIQIDYFDVNTLTLAAFTIFFGSHFTLNLPGKVHIMLSDAAIILMLLMHKGEVAVLLSGIDALLNSLKLRAHGVNVTLRTSLFNASLMSSVICCSVFSQKYLAPIFKGHLTNDNERSYLIVEIALIAFTAIFVNATIGSIWAFLKKSSNIQNEWNNLFFNSSLTYLIGAALAGLAFVLFQNYGLVATGVLVVVIVTFHRVCQHYFSRLQKSITQAEQAERERAEAERERAETEQTRRQEAEKHVAELSQHILEQERIGEALRVSKERFRYAAMHDSLTGLPNRTFLCEQLQGLLEKSRDVQDKGFCVLFLDLDRFKNVNDSLGHAIGDELLCIVGRRLESIVRSGDTVARLGGDEFAIVFVEIAEIEAAVHFAERIYEALAQPFNLSGHRVFTTPSIGLAISSNEHQQPEDVLRDADIAMYHAKGTKSGCSVFNRELRTKAVNTLKTENGLRNALEHDELRVFYQPIIALDSGKLTGFEALMRWQHPERGLVSPAEFIPVAEETGLIVPMTLWIMREACHQLSQWRWVSPQNRSLMISVNLSGKHFGQPDLVDQVSGILKETGLDPHCLKLEITESTVMGDPENTTRVLTQLRKLGVQLSIDDFGTGYSSLSYLHRFPIDTLKVDRSFVMRMGKEGENAEIVRTIVTLAQNLEMQVIAEGVETVEQLEQLRQLNCGYAQGYLFAKPLPLMEMDKLVRQKTNWLPAGVEILSNAPHNVIHLRQVIVENTGFVIND